VMVVNEQTHWVDVVSYSSRTRERTPIGGLIGQVTLAGDLGGLRELLVWGSLVHVGKNAVKGDGWYTIMAA
jgi:CRISPR-associated endoribonuclease Cas6